MIRRLVVPDADLTADRVELPPKARRHLVKVLRAKPGWRVRLLDGRGLEALGELESLSAKAVVVRIIERKGGLEESAVPPLHLVQSLPKGQKLDEIIRRATELGVATVQPCRSSRSVPRVDQKRAAVRLERWRRIATEAARQCGRLRVPVIDAVISFEEALEGWSPEATRIILYERDIAHGLGELVRATEHREVVLLLGPEGGFAEEEVRLAQKAGFVTASLGPLILRAETAAIVACAIVRDALGGLTPVARDPRGGDDDSPRPSDPSPRSSTGSATR